VHLAVGDHRVDDRTGVIDGDHPLQVDRAGLGVDLDDDHVSTERERRLGRLEVGLSAQLAQPAGGGQGAGQL
jgi:hypothetical protein